MTGNKITARTPGRIGRIERTERIERIERILRTHRTHRTHRMRGAAVWELHAKYKLLLAKDCKGDVRRKGEAGLKRIFMLRKCLSRRRGDLTIAEGAFVVSLYTAT